MDPTLTTLLIIFVVLYLIHLIFDWFSRKPRRPVVVQFLVLAFSVFFLNRSTDFPFPMTAFGGSAPNVYIFTTMFVCILFGMVSHYLFFHKDLTLKNCLRPLLVSPILLIPLYGLVDPTSDLSPLRIVYLCLLSYQNGFFWKHLFENIEQKMRNTT